MEAELHQSVREITVVVRWNLDKQLFVYEYEQSVGTESDFRS